MKIIGTGLSGLVGSRIVELLSNDFEFIDFSYDSRVDITNFDLLKKKFLEHKEAGAVIHLAAFTDVNSAWKQNNDKDGICYKVNVLGTKNLASLCNQTKKYLIHISTDFVFDGKNPPVGGYTEKDKPKPIEWYGKTKYWAEEKVKKSNCDYIILRIAFPFKAKSAPRSLEPSVKLDLIRTIIKKLKDKETLTMFSDQIIAPTFIDDIVKTINYCLKNKPKGIYHCVGSTFISPYELAVKISQKFNLNKKLINKASLKELINKEKGLRPRQQFLPISNKKLEKELGIRMLSLDEALNKI